MNISRHNYETYFLLYVDGELSPQEQQGVELFVTQNADLQVELNMLMQTKLDKAQIIFDDKSILFKNTSIINTENYQEQFLLYVDNELTPRQKNEVELFASANPLLQKELNELLSAQLEKENIVFENKFILYKKERKPVSFFMWQRIAVAAIFIGLIIATWKLIPSKKEHSIVKTLPPVKAETPIQQKQLQPSVSNIHKAIINNTELFANKNYQKLKPGQKNTIQTTIADNTKVGFTNNNANVIDYTVNRPPTETIISEITAANNTGIVFKTITTNAVEQESKNIIQSTIYKELETEEEENSSLYVGNIQINKNKLKGLLKKAGALLNKPKDEESKVSIAGIALKD